MIKRAIVVLIVLLPPGTPTVVAQTGDIDSRTQALIERSAPDPSSLVYLKGSGAVVDLAVTEAGRCYALRLDGLDSVDMTSGESMFYSFSAASTVREKFEASRMLAISPDIDGGAIVFWCGLRDGTLESYVTKVRTRESTQLDLATRFVTDFQVTSTGDYIVVGAMTEPTASLVNMFSRSGRHMRSVHERPYVANPKHDLVSVGSSQVVPTADSLFVVNPVTSPNTIFHYATNGRLRQKLSIPGDRMIVTIFSGHGRLYVQSIAGIVVEQPANDDLPFKRFGVAKAIAQVHVLGSSGFELVSEGGPTGPRIGMTPEGLFVARSQLLRGAGIGSGPLHERPALFVTR